MTGSRANLDLAAAELADAIRERFTDPVQQKRSLDALALVVQISADVMEERDGGTTH